ncbi:MAG: stress response translation initiation inhibitor YciH [Nitrososphaerota archaeon]|jgi:translation initiation factor 1|nr:stress response translation initiation inhibitor YciH [Nitrososphaerota archaeon]MDG6948764.1 stress response translation initiation inhibitor YciH [Nitrososphaerota archaeon]
MPNLIAGEQGITVTQTCNEEFQDLLTEIDEDDAKIKVNIERRQYGKEATLIEGIDLGDEEMRKLCTSLKRKFAVGGTYKDGRILLQGDHRAELPEALAASGFSRAKIEVA